MTVSQGRYSTSPEKLSLFTCFGSQAQWSLPLSSHGLAYPYFQISFCIKETASTTWLNLEFDRTYVAGRCVSKMSIDVSLRKRNRTKETQRTTGYTVSGVSSLTFDLDCPSIMFLCTRDKKRKGHSIEQFRSSPVPWSKNSGIQQHWPIPLVLLAFFYRLIESASEDAEQRSS